MKDFFEMYTKNLKDMLDNINYDDIDKIIQRLEKTIVDNAKIYIVGNGGSSATASHMANDLGVGLRRRGIINFNIVSLGDNSAVTSAIANDIGFENIFYMQLEGILKPEDVVIAISCSGNSPNITKTVNYAKNIGSTVIGITG